MEKEYTVLALKAQEEKPDNESITQIIPSNTVAASNLNIVGTIPDNVYLHTSISDTGVIDTDVIDTDGNIAIDDAIDDVNTVDINTNARVTPTNMPATSNIINIDVQEAEFKSIHSKLQSMRKRLNETILERSQEIDGILITIMADSSCLFIGEPGTAKTQMIKLASDLFGLRSFDILLGETTKPEQVFGPTNIPALAKGELYTSIEGYAPDCEVLFLDEVFKANGTVLNPLLWLINEKLYRNGDKGVIKCPVKAVFAASNELPDDDALKAFYDRLILRYEVKSLESVTNIQKMIGTYLKHENESIQALFNSSLFDSLRKYVKSVSISDNLLTTLYNIKVQLERVYKVKISDRRLNKCARLIQAQAVLNGRLHAELEDFEILCHCLWDTPDMKLKIQSSIMSFVNTSIPQLLLYEDMCRNIYDTAVQTGNMKAGLKKLKKVGKLVKKYKGQIAEQVRREVMSTYKKVKGIVRQRQIFTLYAITDGNKTIYQVDGITASLWTYQQMRDCQFKQKRKGNYWYSPESKSTTIANIQNALGVTKIVVKKM